MKNIKKIIGILSIALIAFCTVPVTFTACTDITGDGIDSIYYPGSTLPQNTQYRNPVWEPDFELGTVFRTATNYVAIASETQWAAGITYLAPTMLSNDLMGWSFNGNMAMPLQPDSLIAGTDTTIYKRPDWAEGRIHSMTAGFARAVPSTSYWLFYQIGDEPAIGVAFARSPQGPYSDLGKMMDNTTTASATLKDPFFIVLATRSYLLYSTEEGSFIQELTLKRASMPALRGTATKVSNAAFADVAAYRKGDNYYLFGTVKNGDRTEIRYGRAASITGPYKDKDGNDLLSGNGSLIIESGEQLVNPQNVCGIFEDFTGVDFILYNAMDPNRPTLPSGYNRRPLLLNKLTITEDGWFEGTIRPNVGWTTPKFIYK